MGRTAASVLCSACINHAWGAEPPVAPAFSSDIHVLLGFAALADHEVGLGPLSNGGQFGLAALPPHVDIDGLHGQADGTLLLSLDTTVLLDGVLYRPNDVMRFDGAGWSMAFDGHAAGIPQGANIDALAMAAGALLFSVDIATVLGEVAVGKADIVAFDGDGFSTYASAADFGIDVPADVDALHVDEQGRLYVSFAESGQLAGTTFFDEDLLVWDGAAWAAAIVGRSVSSAWVPADLDAWSLVLIDDVIFSNGFE